MADLTTVAGALLEEQDPLVTKLSHLSPEARKSVDEVVAVITDLEDSRTPPILRRVVHRVFERSVQEFFSSESAESTNLPSDLVRYTVASPSPIPLPEPAEPPELTLADALQGRRSRRSYANEPLDLAELGDMLHLALARNGLEDGYGTRNMPLQPYPSIGGLDPVDIGIVVNRVDGIAPGYYHYDKIGHGLIPVLRGDLRMSLINCTFETEWIFYAPVVLVIVSNQDRVYWKYKTRGYRLSYLDQGAAVQNIYLSCTALGLSCCAIAGYNDEKINRLLGYNDEKINRLLGYSSGDQSVSVLISLGGPAKRAAGTLRS